jgi:glycosyltransferase involved in cell wall biosynthesis
MKILQVCPAFYPAISIGGPIFTILSLQHVLAKKGNTVDVIATPLGLTPQEKVSLTFDKPMPMPMPMPSLGHITYQHYYGYPHFTFSPGTLFWLLKYINNYQVVILHGVWNFPIFVSALVCRFRKVPYIIYPHGTLYQETLELRSSFIKKVFLMLFVKGILKNAKRVIFTTQDESIKVTKFLNIHLASFIMPNIVRTAEFSLLPAKGAFRKKHNISSETLLLLHYGRISKKKGLEFTIQALAKLSFEFPDIILAIIGGDEEGYRTVVERCAESFGVLDNVIFTGLVQRDEGIQAMVDADVFVLPSLSENFGMAVVEAMQCNLPVVLSDNVGIAPDISKAGAGLMVSLSAENERLIEAIAGLLRNPEERINLGNKGKQFAIDHYDEKAVSSIVDELLALI